MNLYHCMIDLHNDARATGFAKSLGEWMDHLQGQGVIGGWTLYRRKLNLTSDIHRDFLLIIQISGLAQLDDAFGYLCSHSDEVDQLYSQVHSQIAAVDYGLYRPFPDPERVERAALL